MSQRNFELKTDETGNPNPKYVDLLEEDRPISGQKFACLSFISPENIIKDKNLYSPDNINALHFINQCLKANFLFHKETN